MKKVVRCALAMVLGFAAALPATLLTPRQLEAQSSEIQVLVAPLATTEGMREDFGRKVAEEVRKSLQPFPGMDPKDWDDVRDALKQYGLDEEELTSIEWRQLANQLQTPLVMVGSASPGGQGVAVDVVFMDPRSGDEMPVSPFSVPDDRSHEQAAAEILGGLEEIVEYNRSIQFCAEYLGSSQFEDALRNCDAALAMNPDNSRALYMRGRVHMESGDYEAAAADLEKVVAASPSNTDALESLAYTYAQLGDTQRSGELYREYLNFNPDDEVVRLKVAFDLATAGANAEAMEILEDGVARSPENADMWEWLGNVSLRAGTDGSEVVDEAAVRRAVEAYDEVVTLKGGETSPSILTNLVTANLALDDPDAALDYSTRAIAAIESAPAASADNGEEEAAPQQSPEELLATIHSHRADIFDRQGDYGQAVSEMDETLALDPSYPSANLKRGNLRLKAGDKDGAIADFRVAVENGQDSNQIAEVMFSNAYSTYFEKGQYSPALEQFDIALEFAETPETNQQIHFFAAYGRYLQGTAIDTANEAAEDCAPARRALGAFQGVGPHLSQAGSYQAASQAQIREAVDVLLYRQEQIIKKSCG